MKKTPEISSPPPTQKEPLKEKLSGWAIGTAVTGILGLCGYAFYGAEMQDIYTKKAAQSLQKNPDIDSHLEAIRKACKETFQPSDFPNSKLTIEDCDTLEIKFKTEVPQSAGKP